MENVRYLAHASSQVINTETTKEYLSALLFCGPGGGLKGKPETVFLERRPSELYYGGQTYTERAEEIHESKPKDGTVTLVTREFKEDEDHAKVFWPAGTEWGSAVPRQATAEEVSMICGFALKRWF